MTTAPVGLERYKPPAERERFVFTPARAAIERAVMPSEKRAAYLAAVAAEGASAELDDFVRRRYRLWPSILGGVTVRPPPTPPPPTQPPCVASP